MAKGEEEEEEDEAVEECECGKMRKSEVLQKGGDRRIGTGKFMVGLEARKEGRRR